MESFSSWRQWLLVCMVLPVLAGCSLIFPHKIERVVSLTPNEGLGEQYRIGEDGSISYLLEGLRIEVKFMADQDLNDLFPYESNLGEYSINPYTYGNYIDPGVGYVQNRFTGFQVSVHNSTFAKVELDPLKAVLTTDRQGELHNSYSVSKAPRRKSFEEYYRSLRGPSGNDYYRYKMRMGIVRSNNYGIDEKIFRGETYEGLIVFDPLEDDVKKVRLQLVDFVLKFNVFEQPLETTDITLEFDRHIDKKTFTQGTVAETRQLTRASLAASSQVSSNIPGDLTREARTIDAYATTQLGGVNRCFEKEFEAGKAAAGQVSVALVILPIGTVESTSVVSSTVNSSVVGECIAGLVKRWRFQPSRILEQETEEKEGEAQTAAPQEQPLSPTKVRATVSFEFIDIDTE
jgi:hypothetical protein